jgi:MinD superfamily P-loop ATPase
MVTKVRSLATSLARDHFVETVIIDGPPGVGCPVIASVTGVRAAVIVTEPTVSGFHDLKRVLSLTEYFRVPVWLVVNRWNINEGITQKMEDHVENSGGVVAGRIPWSDEISGFQKEDDPRKAFMNSSLVENFQIIQQRILTTRGDKPDE